MKVTSTDNLNRTLGAGKKQQVGKLKVPVAGLKVGLPIGFEAKVPGDADLIDENAMLAAAEKEAARLAIKLAAEVSRALEEALKAGVWAWNGGARGIYDTGELLRSGSVRAESGGIVVSYSVPYANIVHNGGYIHPYGNLSARPIYLPPRPWVTSVLYGGGPVPQFDFDEFFRRNAR